jgi:2-oxoglutarate dehydrogenase E1 component
MSGQSSFHRLLAEPKLPSDKSEAKQVVLCSGKVYYDLLEEREKRGQTDVHLLRMEQLYPFPSDALAQELEGYQHCHLVWCQEEPRNMGAWSFVGEFVEEVATELGFERPHPRYAGRRVAASPATGQHSRHVREQSELVDQALTVGLPHMGRIASRKSDEARHGKTKQAAE